ncbi:MAG: hypothetical protein ACYDBQ_08845 [Thermoplasmatota archaeon]
MAAEVGTVVWLALGIACGAVGTSLIVWLGLATRRPRPTTVLAPRWRIAELSDPLVVASHLTDESDIPSGTRILASGMVAPELVARCVVRRVAAVPAEYALDASRKRALLFLGGVRSGGWALQSVDPALVERLANDANRLWEGALPYVEQHALAALPGRSGITVETTGRVRDAVPYQARFLMSLEDQGTVLGVLVDRDPAAIVGERVQVRGGLVRDGKGYSVLEASDVRRIR